MSDVIFEINNVCTDWLEDIRLQVNYNDFVTLIGPSGAGKSSLLYLLNRLKDPNQGMIYYRSQSILDYSIQQLRKEVGMVFQQANLFPGTVRENLLYGPIYHNEYENGLEERLIEMVQLPKDYLVRNVEDLSGGERQRVAFARTLANNPNVLLLDEPTSALDLRTIQSIEGMLMQLVKEQNKTILMVTHDLSQARRLGTKTVFMSGGRVVEVNDTTSLFSSPQTKLLRHFIKGEPN
ncbi:ABC transporter ATP-binding protein [Bacillus solimangrovi]|uniref:Phosphate ABC transporter ATP-binding protein n=1 Tax=Bacillus solimangrovi TaxID=1305675 RepID=A0A1E5LFP0_9BACI|nr:ATP-binding cassette domain-containing protein [Bacillus solimangrovi]OEH92894.1 phosphate ABC transporter ATP-binding protein [Bacillus solimangrovi]